MTTTPKTVLVEQATLQALLKSAADFSAAAADEVDRATQKLSAYQQREATAARRDIVDRLDGTVDRESADKVAGILAALSHEERSTLLDILPSGPEPHDLGHAKVADDQRSGPAASSAGGMSPDEEFDAFLREHSRNRR